ncbi:hypothetical protein [Schlesneria sp.]|uniref:hypothetical protein n=1 Tax=Schlesneria sp. TaxID=2762018 RepID=UPI002EEC0B56
MSTQQEKPREGKALVDPRNLPGNDCCSPSQQPGQSRQNAKENSAPGRTDEKPTEAAEGKKPITAP